MSPNLKRIFVFTPLILLFFLPVAAWTWVKPTRVLAPEWTGVECHGNFVCVDDPARLAEAQRLYQEALAFVTKQVGEIRDPPRAVFCQSTDCAQSFGLYRGAYGYAAAYNVATVGIVISHRGWQPYFVRHELIHHLQNERLGSLRAWWFKPTWFKEGMAYSLSEDPRDPLPEKLEAYRRQFDAWYQKYDPATVWEAAQAL